MKRNKRLYVLMPVIAAAIVLVDQLTKSMVIANLALYERRDFIPSVLGLYHTQNTGASFGIFHNATGFLIAVSILALLLMLYVVIRRVITAPFPLIALAMGFGGALGNLIDRIRLGCVTDMFETLFLRFAIFNVADIFVVCGGLLFCAYHIIHHDSFKAKTAAETPTEEI